MPMKKGYSPEVVSSNIREMVRTGYKPKQAVAAALASKRKYKKMAMGGMVDDDDDVRTMGELQAEGDSHPNAVANPDMQDDERMMAEMLHKRAQSEMGYAMGGLVQPDTMDEPLGTKPSEDMDSMTEEPMSEFDGTPAETGHYIIEGVPDVGGISEDARMALEERKKKRRYSR